MLYDDTIMMYTCLSKTTKHIDVQNHRMYNALLNKLKRDTW